MPKTLTHHELMESLADEKRRNEIAFAHVCCDRLHKPLHRKTCSYPSHRERIVTQEQIAVAAAVREAARVEVLDKGKNGTLLFVGMGMERGDCKAGECANYRFRTRLLNKDGESLFVEFSHVRERGMCKPVRGFIIDHCFKGSDSNSNAGNYRSNEGKEIGKMEENILAFVNIHLGCNFKEMLIDSYNLDAPGEKPLCVS